MHGDTNEDDSRSSSSSSNRSGVRRSNRNSHNRVSAGSSISSSASHTQSSQLQSSPSSSSIAASITSTHTTTTTTTTTEGSHHDPAPPLPPPSRHMQRGGSSRPPRSHSVQDSGLRPPNFTHLPPLPPYTQRSCSTDALMRHGLGRRSHLRTIPTHGPHMASTVSFNPYLSPSISETGSDGEEDIYTGGSECYVTMSSCSEATYLPSTHSDPGTMGRGRSYLPSTSSSTLPLSDTSGTPSDLYITSVDSECSGASYRVNSPPPLYREVDEEHSVPINFDSMMPRPPPPLGGRAATETMPNSAAISMVSPIIPIATSEPGSAVFDFDAAAVLSRTQELEGELQRLRVAMTCRLCKQNPIGATFCPCGHTVCCYQCAQRMHSCWECDETVSSVQRMLLSR